MRFYLGFSKRISLKWILTIIGALLVFFGIFSSAHAVSFDTIQNWSWCPFNSSSYNSTGCVSISSSDMVINGSLYGINGIVKPTTNYYTSQGYSGKEKHTEFYKYGGTSDCNTGETISFYADIILNDVNGTLPNNTLDYTQWPTSPVVRSGQTRDLSYNGFYQWLANNSEDLTNRYGISVSKSDGTSSSNCRFVSFGSNKSIRFLCSVDSGPTGYQLKLNAYNYNGQNNTNSAMSGVQVVSALKISMLNDPCTTQPNNNQGVIDSINGQTSDIIDGIGGIIDNQNANSDRAHQDAEDIKDKLDEANSHLGGIEDGIDSIDGKLDGIGDSVDRLTCQVITWGNVFNYTSGEIIANGSISGSDYYRVSDYFIINDTTNYYFKNNYGFSGMNIYGVDKNLLRVVSLGPQDYDLSSYISSLNISGAYYFRITFDKGLKLQLKRCSSLLSSEVNTPNNFITINDGHGVSDILNAPIRLFRSLSEASSDTCDPLVVPLSFMGQNTNLSLPCGAILWDNCPLSIKQLYWAVIWGFLCYRVLLHFVNGVHNVVDPDFSGEVVNEVRDL